MTFIQIIAGSSNGPPATLCVALRAGRINMFYYTYVLVSEKDGDLYIGWSSDLRARIIKHNNGLVNATRERKPMKLVYYEACLNKTKAIEREKQLKTGFGRSYLKRRLM